GGLVGGDGGLGAVVEFELGKDAGDVGGGGVFVDEQGRADLRVGLRLGDQLEYLDLTCGELSQPWRRFLRSRQQGELFDDTPGDRRGEEPAAVGDDPDRGEELVFGGVFGEDRAGVGG